MLATSPGVEFRRTIFKFGKRKTIRCLLSTFSIAREIVAWQNSRHFATPPLAFAAKPVVVVVAKRRQKGTAKKVWCTCRVVVQSCLLNLLSIAMGEQGWRSGESNRLPPKRPGLKSQRQRHMWVEFVVGSLLCSKRFFSGYFSFPFSSKTNISKFQFEQESGRRRTTMWMWYLQIVIYLLFYFVEVLVTWPSSDLKEWSLVQGPFRCVRKWALVRQTIFWNTIYSWKCTKCIINNLINTIALSNWKTFCIIG